ncbi:MAG: hypothetical protein QM626_14745 [Microbacterium sp.]|uniref:hypothetical protein n=1 Tax=Microbacterium sp. TaxID=51671 RepID=UPI0039E3066B
MSSASSRSDLAALTSAVDEVLAAVRACGRPDAVVLVDGRSGAGKTTLAGMLKAAWPGSVDVLAMDDVYPGWDGLAAASETLATRILAPRAAGTPGQWERWDWRRGVPADTARLRPGRALVVEGDGSLTPATARFADVTVWLDGPAALRRERALARDGETYAPHWERWAAQERAHIDRHDPRGLAQLVYDAADPSTASSTARTSPSSR